MENFKSKTKDFINSEKFFYFVCSLFFAASFAFKTIFGDDKRHMELFSNKNIADILKFDIERYFTWASRILVNFFSNCLIVAPKFIWLILMGASMYIMMSAFSVIFNIRNKRGALLICFFTMLLPWQIYSTAGWIATTATYFIPIAAGTAGFIPIAKIHRSESLSKSECIFCPLALLFAANIEQAMAVSLGIYLIADIYFIATRRFKPILAVQLLLCILSALYTFLCPGNEVRKAKEISNWFPSYPMFDAIDKADMGLFSTLNSLFSSSINIFVICITLLIAYIGFKKYKQPFYRIIFALPTTMLLLLGPLYNVITSNLFPYIKKELINVPRDGVMTPTTVNSLSSLSSIAILLGMLLLILLCVILISDNIFQMISNIVILGAGLMSRAVMGFSPTIYASSTRTFSVLYICMLTFAVKIYSENLIDDELTERKLSFYSVCFPIVIALCFINLLLIP